SLAHSADAKVPKYQILRQMGAEGQFVVPDRETLKQYIAVFRQLDTGESWELSTLELTTADEASRISVSRFAAADTDKDGILSQDEFVRLRVIQDEASSIFQRIDANHDDQVTSEEFINGSGIENASRATATFKDFDANKDGILTVDEVLPVWDDWARQEPPPVTARIIVKQKRYELSAERQSAEFRKRIETETDVEKLPTSPRVRLILELKNVGDKPLGVWPGGGIDEPEVMVEGDGLVRPDNLQGDGGSSSSTTPQPVIEPGKTFRVRIRSLNPDEIGFYNV
ncbi:MAG: Ca2+-binding EF-hand superfamily protein, partial [Planctomycetaceae bacterium]